MNNKDFNENAIRNIDDIRILPNQQEYSTYEEMKKKQSELMQITKKKVKQMTESFDLDNFYKSTIDMIALIVITPNQVATVYGDEKKLLHDEIMPITKELISNKKKYNNPRIIIRCAKTEKLSFFASSKSGHISKQMNELMEIFYKKLETMNQGRSDKRHKIKIEKIEFNKLLYTIQDKMKRINYEKDKEIVGITLDEYIKKLQKKQESEMEL